MTLLYCQLSNSHSTNFIIPLTFIIIQFQQRHLSPSLDSLGSPDYLSTYHDIAPVISIAGPSLASQKMVSAAVSSASFQTPSLKISTANHDDGEKSKRFGYKAPTLAACLEIYLQDTMPDSAVGILLNLTPREVEKLKSRIHQLLSGPIFPPDANIDFVSF